MSRSRFSIGATLLALIGAAVALLATVLPQQSQASGVAPAAVRRSTHSCGRPQPHHRSCSALVRLNKIGTPAAGTAPGGLAPADLQSAYRVSGTTAAGRTVAIVDAYHDPTAAADLAKYRRAFHLPPCTTANRCFRQVNQRGSTVPPAVDPGWAGEISLDVDMVSAICPACHILLVEASSSSDADLATAVNYAASQHVTAISNSYGGPDQAPNPAYDHPGIAVVASTGDDGYGVEAPASYPSVVAVGGTSLSRAAGARGWAETAWSGAGSGCSTRNARPSWQNAVTRCRGKANADVSAVADPNTGVAVYDSTPYQGAAGWQIFGGTSASAPIVAGVFALSGRTDGYPARRLWAGRGRSLFDVRAGVNGNCTPRVWCQSGAGWDGPTGLGSPNGTAAF